jgi:hypothetical protein
MQHLFRAFHGHVCARSPGAPAGTGTSMPLTPCRSLSPSHRPATKPRFWSGLPPPSSAALVRGWSPALAIMCQRGGTWTQIGLQLSLLHRHRGVTRHLPRCCWCPVGIQPNSRTRSTCWPTSAGGSLKASSPARI